MSLGKKSQYRIESQVSQPYSLKQKHKDEILVRVTTQTRYRKIDHNRDNDIALPKEMGDIEILITDEQRYHFLKHFNDKTATEFYSWKTSTFSHILQSEIAKYNKEHLDIQRSENRASELNQIDDTMLFINKLAYLITDLEAEINKPDLGDLAAGFSKLKNKLSHYQNNIQAQINDLLAQDLSEDYDRLLRQLRDELDLGITNYIQSINDLETRATTTRQNRKLFSIQDESAKIQALGSFVCDQMTLMSAFGIKRVYQITDDRFAEALRPHPAIKALSLAKTKIEKKGLSLGGVRYNDSRMPHPPGMLHAFKPAIADTTESDSRKWMSLKDYINVDDIEEVNEALSFLSGRLKKEPEKENEPSQNLYQVYRSIKNYFNRESHSWETFKSFVSEIPHRSSEFFKKSGGWLYDRGTLYLGLVLAIAVELTVFIPIRLFLELISIPFSFLNIFIPHFNKRFSTTLSNIYERLSPVKFIKNKLTANYRLDFPTDDEHQQILNVTKGHSKSTFNMILSTISGYNISVYLGKALKQIFSKNAITDVYTNFKQFGYSYGKRRREIAFLNMEDRVKQSRLQTMQQLLQEMQKPEVESSRLKIVDHDKLLHPQKLEKLEQAMALPSHPRVKRCSVNKLNSPMDFFDEIFDILCDGLVDHSFKEAPVLASASAIVAMLSFGAAHGLLHGDKFIAVIKALPSYFAKYTMGQEIDSATTEAFALFVQWKLTFLSLYGTQEFIYARNFDFMKEIVREPEKITLGLMITIGTGYGLGTLRELFTGSWGLPTIPLPGDFVHTSSALTNSAINQSVNFVIAAFNELYNLFPSGFEYLAEESLFAREGVVPFTTLEYAFLGLKSLLLIDAMFSGTHRATVEKIDPAKLLHDLEKSGVIKIDDPDQRRTKLKRILAAQGLYELDTSDEFSQLFKDLNKEIEGIRSGTSLRVNQEFMRQIKSDMESGIKTSPTRSKVRSSSPVLTQTPPPPPLWKEVSLKHSNLEFETEHDAYNFWINLDSTKGMALEDNLIIVRDQKIHLQFDSEEAATQFCKKLDTDQGIKLQGSSVILLNKKPETFANLFTAFTDEQQVRVDPLMSYCKKRAAQGSFRETTKVNKLMTAMKAIEVVLNCQPNDYISNADFNKIENANITDRRFFSGAKSDLWNAFEATKAINQGYGSKLEQVTERLKHAISVVHGINQEFPTETAARVFYDYLDDAFNAYNKEVLKLGRRDRYIDKKDFMHSFYNKYCYNPTSNFLKFVSILPFFFITYPWRAFKYYVLGTPSTRHQVTKSFKKDAAMLIQTLSFLVIRPLRTVSRMLGYIFLRFPIILIASPYILFGTLIEAIVGAFNKGPGGMSFWRKAWNLVGDFVSQISIHRFMPRGTISFRPLFNLTVKPVIYLAAFPFIAITSIFAAVFKLVKIGRGASTWWNYCWNKMSNLVNPYVIESKTQRKLSVVGDSAKPKVITKKKSLWSKFKDYVFSYNNTLLVSISLKPTYADLSREAGADCDDMNQKCLEIYSRLVKENPQKTSGLRPEQVHGFKLLRGLSAKGTQADKCIERAAHIIASDAPSSEKVAQLDRVKEDVAFGFKGNLYNFFGRDTSQTKLFKQLHKIQDVILDVRNNEKSKKKIILFKEYESNIDVPVNMLHDNSDGFDRVVVGDFSEKIDSPRNNHFDIASVTPTIEKGFDLEDTRKYAVSPFINLDRVDEEHYSTTPSR